MTKIIRLTKEEAAEVEATYGSSQVIISGGVNWQKFRNAFEEFLDEEGKIAAIQGEEWYRAKCHLIYDISDWLDEYEEENRYDC